MSRMWIWAVLGGLAIAGALLYHVGSSILSGLPEEIRASVKDSARRNVRPLGVAGVVLAWTLVFALYSMTLAPSNPSSTSSSLTAGGSSDVAAPSANGGATSAAAPATATGHSPSAITGGSAAPTVSGGPSADSGVKTGAPHVAIKPAHLFSGAANTRGISSNTIKLCGHAPLSLGAVLNTKPADVLVYFRYANDRGGIHGRKFDVTLTDDQYSADQSVAAAQQCKEQNPFLIFGSIGSDVIPPVRQWAETNKELYLYGFSAKAGTAKLRYSFGLTISQEDLSIVMANQAAQRYPGSKVAIVWRNSDNFQPGREAFKKEIRRHGMQIVADLPVTKDQGAYSQEVLDLQRSGAQVVFMLDDAFSQTNMMKQAKSQQYNPQWLVFPFNIMVQTLKEDSFNPALNGVNLAPAYTCHQYGGPFASYASEIKTFEAAYKQYSPNTDLCGIAGDVAWQGWVAERTLVAMFDSCGRGCTRDLFAGMLLGGWKARIGAACTLDFSADGHHGGFAADWLKAYHAPDGTPALFTDRRCLRAE